MSRGDGVHLNTTSASVPFFSVIVDTDALGEFEPESRRVLTERRRVLCLCACCAKCTPSFDEYGLRSCSYRGPRPHLYGI